MLKSPDSLPQYKMNGVEWRGQEPEQRDAGMSGQFEWQDQRRGAELWRVGQQAVEPEGEGQALQTESGAQRMLVAECG